MFRLRVLEAAAEKLQAALLASIEEEEVAMKQQPKAKRKASKKGKRSKKSGNSTPPVAIDAEAPTEEEAADPAEQELSHKGACACAGGAELRKEQHEGSTDPSDGSRSETGSESTGYNDRGGHKGRKAAQSITVAEQEGRSAHACAQVSSPGKVDVEWKEVRSTCCHRAELLNTLHTHPTV
jgi:hypothetical protein